MERRGRNGASAGSQLVAAIRRGVSCGVTRRRARPALEDDRLQAVGMAALPSHESVARQPPSQESVLRQPVQSGFRRLFGLSPKMSAVAPASAGQEEHRPLEFAQVADIAARHNWHTVDISGSAYGNTDSTSSGGHMSTNSSCKPVMLDGCTAVILYCDSTRIDVALRSVAYIRWDAHRRRQPLPPLIALVSDLWVGCEEVERMFVLQGVQQLCQVTDPVDDVIQIASSEADLTLAVMLSLTRLSRLRRQAQASSGISHSEGTVSFFVSQSSSGGDFMSATNSALPDLVRIQERDLRPEKKDAEVNTLVAMGAFKPPCERHDAEVNTNVVMDGFDFRCANCSRPPKAPAPKRISGSDSSIAPVDMRALEERKNKMKKKKANRKTSGTKIYTGRKFNGEWEAFPPEGKEVNEWLRMFTIVGGDVLLGDQSYVNLLQDDEDRLWIYGGELISMPTPDMFIRRGRGGTDIAFVKRADISDKDLSGSAWSMHDELSVEQLARMCEDDDGRSEASECPSLASLADIGA